MEEECISHPLDSEVNTIAKVGPDKLRVGTDNCEQIEMWFCVIMVVRNWNWDNSRKSKI